MAGPQFASEEFTSFAQKWGFDHITSSTCYPQSNGKAENVVKTVKWLFTKCWESGQSEFLALMDWRNTPTEGLDTSPASRFLGHRCKTLLPITGSWLLPDYPTEEDRQSINKQKQRQQYYYTRHIKELKPIAAGEIVRMRLPGQKCWSQGVCTGLVGPWSYSVKVGEVTFIRNRRQLICSDKQPVSTPPDLNETEHKWQNNCTLPTPPNNQPTLDTNPTPELSHSPNAEPSAQSPCPEPCRLTRNRKPPDWITMCQHELSSLM